MRRCEQYQAQLLDHLYGLLDAEEGCALTAHLEQCPACRGVLCQAESHQQLLSAAAKSKFPGVEFQPPAAIPISTAAKTPLLLPETAKRPAWVRWVPAVSAVQWAAAASVLVLIGGVGVATALVRQGYLDRQARADAAKGDYQWREKQLKLVVQERQAPVKELEKIKDKLSKQRTPREELAEADDNGRRQRLRMTVTGPASAEPGGTTKYDVVIRDLHDQPTDAELSVRAVPAAELADPQRAEMKSAAKDDAHALEKAADQRKGGKDIDVQRQGPGNYVIVLPPDLDVNESTRLQLTAKPKEGDVLCERLPLGAPLFLTHLTLDKPVYRPGEVLAFRSLTLERSTLKPPTEVFEVAYTLTDSEGRQVARLDGRTHLVDALGKEIQGADRQPVRGIGTGQLPIDPSLKGGEYTLTVTESLNRFPPEQRRFAVLSKGLDVQVCFDKDAYAPGEQVEAEVSLPRADRRGGSDPAMPAITAGLEVDGRRFGLDGLQNNDNKLSARLAADANGKLKMRFKLPPKIERGDANLYFSFGEEILCQPIPINLKKLSVEFFPEGGDLIAGLPNTVYFQAGTLQDRPVELKGRIVDAAGQMVVPVQTWNDPARPELNHGLGRFEFTPVEGMKYELRIDSPAGTEGRYELPPVKADGVVLHVPAGVTSGQEPIRVVVRSGRKDRSLLVGFYCRGRLVGYRTVIAKKEKVAEIALKPATGMGGVYRVTVFEDGSDAGRQQLVPVAERLIYRAPAERLNLALKTDQQEYGVGDKVTVTATVTDEKGQPTPALLLFWAVDRSPLGLIDDPTAHGLPAHFLLTSEVRKAEDLEHADFLLADQANARTALDLLLGTQGWRRFAEQQNPEDFLRQEGEEAERLLATTGRTPVKTTNRVEVETGYEQYLAEEWARIHSSCAAQFQALQQQYDAAYSAALAVQKDEKLLAEQKRLENERLTAEQRYLVAQSRFNEYRLVLSSVLLGAAIVLLGIGVGSLLIGIVRRLPRRAAYCWVAGVALTSALVVGFFFARTGPEALRFGANPEFAQLEEIQDPTLLKKALNENKADKPNREVGGENGAVVSGADSGGGSGSAKESKGALPPAGDTGRPEAIGNRSPVVSATTPPTPVPSVSAPVPSGTSTAPAPQEAAPSPPPAAVAGGAAPLAEPGVSRKELHRANLLGSFAADKKKLAEDEAAKNRASLLQTFDRPMDRDSGGFGNIRYKEAERDLKLRSGYFPQTEKQQAGGEGKGEGIGDGKTPGKAIQKPEELLRHFSADELKATAKSDAQFEGPAPKPAFGAGVKRDGESYQQRARELREKELESLPPFVVRVYAHKRPAEKDKARPDLAETLYWHPALVLPGGTAQVSFDLNDLPGLFRVTAYGHTPDGRLGATTATFEAKTK